MAPRKTCQWSSRSRSGIWTGPCCRRTTTTTTNNPHRWCSWEDSWQEAPWEETERRIVEATGSTRALIDSTGVGDPIVERLQQRLPNVERQKFTPASKQQLMEGLAVAIQAREVSFPEGPITAELLAFEYQYTRTGVRYAATEGMHDDCVDALALAVRRRTKVGSTLWDLADTWGPVEELLR